MENFGHLYRDGKITAVVRDLRLSLNIVFALLLVLCSRRTLSVEAENYRKVRVEVTRGGEVAPSVFELLVVVLCVQSR